MKKSGFKMKGFSGFGNSPVKQDSNAPEMPKNDADRKIMQDEWDSLSPEQQKHVMEQQSKVKPVEVKETVVVEGEAPAKMSVDDRLKYQELESRGYDLEKKRDAHYAEKEKEANPTGQFGAF